MDSFFSGPDLTDNLCTRAASCCGMVGYNHKGKPKGSFSRTIKSRWDDVHARVRGDLTAVIWKDKQDILTNIQKPTEDNFYEECGEVPKLAMLKTTIGKWAT
jgi:hypothetical protein